MSNIQYVRNLSNVLLDFQFCKVFLRPDIGHSKKRKILKGEGCHLVEGLGLGKGLSKNLNKNKKANFNIFNNSKRNIYGKMLSNLYIDSLSVTTQMDDFECRLCAQTP